MSNPGADQTYGAGDTITVRLTMSESVFVTGRPHIWLDVGGRRRKAVYIGPNSMAVTDLDFSYVVQRGDIDTDGVKPCTLGSEALPFSTPVCGQFHLNGGSIRTELDEVDVGLYYHLQVRRRVKSGHKVDAVGSYTPRFLSTSCSDEIRVPSNWALKPSGLNAGKKFRLLFITSTEYEPPGGNIADSNRRVRDRAGRGHSAIQLYSDGFRVLGSTSSVDARDNTCSTHTNEDKGVPIYWLKGNKVADDYADFYDGNWDDQTNPKDEGGGAPPDRDVWTGSSSDGTAHSGDSFGDGHVEQGNVRPGENPISDGAASTGRRDPLYGLSQVFKVREATDAATTSVEITSSPGNDGIYGLDDRVEITVTFSEKVDVRGAPRLGLSIRRSGTGGDGDFEAAFVDYKPDSSLPLGVDPTKLVFAFQVPAGLTDTDGIELHSTALRLNGGEILARADGIPATWTIAAGKNLGGVVVSTTVLSGGICDRTPAVRDAILVAVSDGDDCSEVTTADLARITGFLTVTELTSLKLGDFAGLSGVTLLSLYGTGIETLPVGLFDGLDSLGRMNLQVGLTHLPKDIFRGLGKVTRLFMEGPDNPSYVGRHPNFIRAGGLPDGIFEPLSIEAGNTHRIFGNPGYPSVRINSYTYAAPTLEPRAADAGPGGTVSAGQRVTLGGPGNDSGVWGSKAFYEWWQRDADGDEVNLVRLSVRTDGSPYSERYRLTGSNIWAQDPHPTFTVPALAETTELRFQLRLEATGGCHDGSSFGYAAATLCLRSPVSEARFTIRGVGPKFITATSQPIGSQTYRSGETIEVAVTFGDRMLVDTSQGTPSLALTVGTNTRQASYVRGSGTTRLVFAYTVQSDDEDTDGIEIGANALALNGGAIVNPYGVAAILDHDALGPWSGNKVNGAMTHGFSLADGICSRTAAVRDRLVDLVNDVPANSAVTDCSLVTEAHLAALTGTLDLSGASVQALKRGDFAGLGGISMVDVSGHAITDFPAGTFEGLDDTLTTLNLSSLVPTSLSARVFEKLTGLTDLNLTDLVNVESFTGDFAPLAVAGPEEGIDVVSGGTVVLGVEGAENGQEDPWGKNVAWAWTRTSGNGGTQADTTAARASFTAPVVGEDETHVFRLAATGMDGSYVGTDDVTVRVAAGPVVERVSFTTAAASAGGPAYTDGVKIEVALGFDRKVTVDTSGGTPSVSLRVGSATRSATYLSGSGTRELVFGYTVAASDSDTDGVDVVGDSLALNGGSITAVSDGGAAALGHAALAGGSGRPVSGAGTPVVAAGICTRTDAVEAAILARVRANEDNAALACGAVTTAMLAAISGSLDVRVQVSAHGRMTALRGGDFAWLSNVTALDLGRHALRTFPAGVFDDLVSLRELSISYNQTRAEDALTTLPADLFNRLTKLTVLRLEFNDLETLPDLIFEKLTRLATLTLRGNPWSTPLLPVAIAGPEGGLDAEAGESVTLGSDADLGGPWGSNLVYSWRQASGPTAAVSSASAARPTLIAPPVTAASELVFELTAAGRGSNATATDRVTVRVSPGAILSSLAIVSEPVTGDSYRRDETVSVAATFAKPVTVTGTPRLALEVGTAARQAVYARGSGTRTLVFEYTVAAEDDDTDGIAVVANALTLNGGAVSDAGGTAAALAHAALAAQPGHKVDGSRTHGFSLTAGICGRTPAVRDALLARVRAETANVALGCHQVTTTQLGALTGTLHLGDREIRTLKAGDFGGLGGISAVDLSGNELAGLLSGAFRGLDDTLTRLDLSRNELATLPAELFRGNVRADAARSLRQRARRAGLGRVRGPGRHADTPGPLGQRALRPAGAGLPGADRADFARSFWKSRQRAFPPRCEGGPGERDPCGPGRERHPRGGGGHGRPGGSLGDERHLFLAEDLGRVRDLRNGQGPGHGPSGLRRAVQRRRTDLRTHRHRQGRRLRGDRHGRGAGRRGPRPATPANPPYSCAGEQCRADLGGRRQSRERGMPRSPSRPGTMTPTIR